MECVTCSLDSQVSEGGVDGALGHCGWVSIRRNCENCDEGMTFIVSCAGNKVPQNYRYQPILKTYYLLKAGVGTKKIGLNPEPTVTHIFDLRMGSWVPHTTTPD